MMTSRLEILDHVLTYIAVKTAILTVLILGITLPLIITTSLVFLLVESFGPYF